MHSTIDYQPGKAWADAELLGLLRRCVIEFGQAGVMQIHDPVAAAFSGRDSRWPVGRGRVPRRSSGVLARRASAHARPARIRLFHLNFR